MGEKELEEIMLSFIAGEIDVLVSTTIIETGLDIPNANTLIIQDADKMGLSQLYQIRGRVGRSNRTSYAFLLYKKGKSLTEESEKRLKAIREFYGAGLRHSYCPKRFGNPWGGKCIGSRAARPHGGGGL